MRNPLFSAVMGASASRLGKSIVKTNNITNPKTPIPVLSSRNPQARIPIMKTKLLVLGALFASLCISAQGQLVDKTPVLHLSFDQVSGATAGSIATNTGSGGSAMNGTLTGAGATIVGGGKFGNALSISGSASSDAYVHIANAVVPLTYGNNWTLAMWIQTSTAGGCYAYQGDGGWVGNDSDRKSVVYG